jgi:membrane protein DedA with SNARE-associated domain
MRALIILLTLIFILLPPDAQFWLVGLLRDAWLSPTGQAFLVGLLGSTAGAMLFYAAGWNSLARQLHREDYSKADEAYRRRRK